MGEAAKTMMSKSCVGKKEMALYGKNFPENKCRNLTTDEIASAQNMMLYNHTEPHTTLPPTTTTPQNNRTKEQRSKRSILTDQLNAITFGRQYIEITHCSFPEMVAMTDQIESLLFTWSFSLHLFP